jgi:TonB-like protein
MKLPGVPYQPSYTNGEIVFGVLIAISLHLAAIGPFVYRAIVPSKAEEEEPLVSRPVVQASLLKLGKPLDPAKLPDRFVPQQRTAPKKDIVASKEDPGQKKDAGPPDQNAQDSDISNLISKSDPFAEDAGKKRPEEGHESGIDGGQETDPNKVRAGDMYAAQLGQFFGQHLTLPTVITPAQEKNLCAVFEINIGKNMVIWHVKNTPVKASGNELFDDSARSMLLKLLEDKTPLPNPPKDVDELYRGRRVQIITTGQHGDPSRCNPK